MVLVAEPKGGALNSKKAMQLGGWDGRQDREKCRGQAFLYPTAGHAYFSRAISNDIANYCLSANEKFIKKGKNM